MKIKVLLALLPLFISAFSIVAQNGARHIPWVLEGANERIEKYRKGDITIQLELPDGTFPLNNNAVHVELKKHQFKFGTSMTQAWGFYKKPDYGKYRKHIDALFNYVTLGFYWGWIEGNKGDIVITEHTLDNLKWAKEHGKTIKGHPLVWHNTLPAWLENMTDTKAIDQIITHHVKYLIRNYPEVSHWDVYNEAAAAFKNHVAESGITRWVEYKGGVNKAVESLFTLTNDTDPGKLYINNHYTPKHQEFKELNQYLVEKNVPPGAIGIQTHMHMKDRVLSEQETWDFLEEYSKFGIPIHLTEVSVLSSEPFANWKDMQSFLEESSKAEKKGLPALVRLSTPAGEQYQADYLKDFYTLAFSHPAVEAIALWDATDQNGWRGSAVGILDMNYDPKPAYEALYKLIKKEWHTDIKTRTNDNGIFSFRGFYGDYEGTVQIDSTDYHFNFTHSSEDTTRILKVKLTRSEAPRPNIILIMGDDLSPRWFSIYNEQKNISTPNLDRLGSEGVCFQTAWATPMCTPTRGLLMTGQYGTRTGWLHNELRIPDKNGDQDFIARKRVTTFAGMLKGAGYRTAFCGRWGIPSNWGKAKRDYDDYFLQITTESLLPDGVKLGERSKTADPDHLFSEAQYKQIVSLDPQIYDGKQKASFGVESITGYGYGTFFSRYWHPAINHNGKLVLTQPDDFALDLYVDFAVDFLDRNKNQPGLVYMPLHMPHLTTVRVKEGVSKLPTTPLSGRPGTNYNGNMKECTEYIDQAIGNLLSKLKAKKLLENTIIIFAGDNGDTGSGKMCATENGARVPFIVWGPGIIKQRGLTDELCEFSDVFPTLADYAGVSLPEGQQCDGKSLKPFLSGETDKHRNWIFSYIATARMLRTKHYLIEAYDTEFGSPKGRVYDCSNSAATGFGYREITNPSGDEKLSIDRLYHILDELPHFDFTKEPAKSELEKYRRESKFTHRLVNWE
ncbi:MAG: endo-1,4-beta-xylanase [Mangrovibacterium sp.]